MHKVSGRLLRATAFVAVFAMLMGVTLAGSGHLTSAHDAEMDGPHPAHIHAGACDALGDVVAPLSDVSAAPVMDGTPMAGTMQGSAAAVPVEISVTTVQMALADILGADHAINIHESAENIGNYIACGNIGGAVMGSDLAIGIGTLNDSYHSGVATLHDNGDGTTTVSVYLTYRDDDEMEGEGEGEDDESGTPAADAGGDAAAAGSQVEIKDFTFGPSPTTVKVGDTVTWTNNDTAPHTVTQDPSGSGFQSGKIDPGQTFSYTFTTAGTFDYYCEFHPNMKGQVIVQ